MALLATKLRNQILTASSDQDLPLRFKLKNTTVNGRRVGCAGFITDIQTGSCVYVNTEHSVYGPLSDKVLYRYARDEKDFSSNSLKNGWNRFCADDELAKNVLALLRGGSSITI